VQFFATQFTPKQVANGLFVVDDDMQVSARHRHIAVACGGANLR
jgi:hypothetical protein